MGLGSIFGKLFGGAGSGSGGSNGAEPEEAPVQHNGLLIVAAPMKEGSQYRTAGFIEKREGETVQRTPFIRADNHATRDAAITHTIQKGKQLIDEQGESVLSRDHA